MDALLPGATEWATFNAGDSFEVAANVTFQVKMAAQVAYFCTYG